MTPSYYRCNTRRHSGFHKNAVNVCPGIATPSLQPEDSP